MELAELLDRLGYEGSRSFMREERGDFKAITEYGHIFRRAAGAPCFLKGVYVLGPGQTDLVPVVYVCETTSEEAALKIHKLVWNQNVVPFLIVNSPDGVRLYPGFRYREGVSAGDSCLQILTEYGKADEIDQFLKGFRAEEIDSGLTWQMWGREVTPESRVDWHLLHGLKRLDKWLQQTEGLKRHVSHALIGKYVYLHYLRDRQILSPAKLGKWGIPKEKVFGREATVEGLRATVRELTEWLNGDVFPLDLEGKNALQDWHVQHVAGTFAGDQPRDDGSWQFHLDFKAYDFSYIPIETLSIVYEQFLHVPEPGKRATRGRSVGAYYTPIPVVNFMLSELEERRPLGRGMRVFDPSCGSGAFLVQSFRRLIEKEFPPGSKTAPSLVQLRDLLTDHIFGVDRDPDACSVTELSLVLTMLDYVNPPDLENGRPGRPPRLPQLRNKNIFCDDFFREETPWERVLSRKRCDWIVGNPPWRQLNSKKLEESDRPIWDWMRLNHKDRPVGSNQTARAFAWRASEYVADNGEIAMFLPAMTLFEDPARKFREKFLRKMKVHAVANFANLAEVISARRFRVPASAFFYTVRREHDPQPDEEEAIRTYSPLVANQEATRPVEEHKRSETWSLVVNASEVRDIRLADVLDGSGLPWKLATWGSHLDRRLLQSLRRRFSSLKDLEVAGVLIVSEGPQLRKEEVKHGSEKTQLATEVIGAKVLDVDELVKMRAFFVFPQHSLKKNDKCFLRLRGGKRGLEVCRSPHVIVSAARNFAIYSEEFLVVPPRQIGIVSPSDDRGFLEALSLFLSSDFAFYHQFLTSTQFGVQRGLATLSALRQMPIPLCAITRRELRDWARLHGRLVRATREGFSARAVTDGPLFDQDVPRSMTGDLLDELNVLVYEALGLSCEERSLLTDLVRVRLELNDGKLGQPAVRQPKPGEVRAYAQYLKAALDTFVEGEIPKRHKVGVVYDDLSAMVRAELTSDRPRAREMVVARAGHGTAKELEKTRQRLRQERSQWVYFDRNLRVYDGTTTYILKPMQRFHWTQTQARLDAGEIIAETLAQGES